MPASEDKSDQTSILRPSDLYQQLLEQERISADAGQADVVVHLDRLHQALTERPTRPGGLRRLLNRLSHTPVSPVRGIYLWGGVGAGKTMLMDLVYDSLPFKEKKRTHFHRFMHQLQSELKASQGKRDPIHLIVSELAQHTRVLCFDEFVVNDIGDAMILATFLEALFEQGICLMATSNTEPERLYEHGLQRQRFLPAIDLIQKHTETLHLEAARDYRLRLLARAPTYYSPHDSHSESAMRKLLQRMATTAVRPDETLVIDGRQIPTIACTDDIAWFQFRELCDAPRGKGDYIEIACDFGTVMISNVPCMDGSNDQARRFITLVDELYDRNVKLVLSAATEPRGLYTTGRLKGEFVRTASRLMEMRTQAYLSKQHHSESILSSFH